MSIQSTDLKTPNRQRLSLSPSRTSVPDDHDHVSTASPSTTESDYLENIVICSYNELVERIPDAVKQFIEINQQETNRQESTRVYIGSSLGMGEVLNYFPSHPATGSHQRNHLSYYFVRNADDLLHVYLREVSSGNHHGAGAGMLRGLFEVWRRQICSID
jgi:hypothetical protein